MLDRYFRFEMEAERLTAEYVEVFREVRDAAQLFLFAVLSLNTRGDCPNIQDASIFRHSYSFLFCCYLNTYIANDALSTKGHLCRPVSMGMAREGGNAPTPSRGGNRLRVSHFLDVHPNT